LGRYKAAAALGLPVRKDAEGHRLMLTMARPRKPRPGEDPAGIYWNDDPDKLRRLIAYNVRDVETERELYRRVPPLSDAEQILWQLDSAINRRGFHVDVPLAEAARKIVVERRAAINQELATLTGGRITSIAQVNRIANYLKERGHKVAGVGKRSGALRFCGSATGRWSGSGFQPHNLLRAQPADLEAAGRHWK
jgi:DNA polymerase